MRILIAFMICIIPVLAVTIHVPGDYATIQEAIDAAQAGDTVLVAPGPYQESIDFKGKAILLTSSGGPESTVIEGGGYASSSVVTFASGEGPDSVIEGFTITNGWSTKGGGIRCDQASPTIRHNVISGNSCGDIHMGGAGGAVYSFYGSPQIHDNLITANSVSSHYSSSAGGGIYCSGGAAIVKRNRIAENYARGSGGGIWCSGSAMVEHNTIVKNQAARGGGISCGGMASIVGNLIINNTRTSDPHGTGGGIYCSGESILIEGNIIAGNSTYWGGGGIYCVFTADTVITNNTICNNWLDWFAYTGGGGLYIDRDSTVYAANNILWGNQEEEIYLDDTYGASTLTIRYSDVEGGLAGVHVGPGCTLNWQGGMIDLDPRFVDPPPPNHDLHLLYDSPCRDAGDNTAVLAMTDFEGDPRVAHGTADMGADEFHTHLYTTGDATPGGTIQGKLVGLPGASPLGLFFGSGVLDPPLSTMWGLFYLQAPWVLITLPGSIPANGVMVLPATLPGSIPAPYDLPMQAWIGSELTNLSVLEVR